MDRHTDWAALCTIILSFKFPCECPSPLYEPPHRYKYLGRSQLLKSKISPLSWYGAQYTLVVYNAAWWVHKVYTCIALCCCGLVVELLIGTLGSRTDSQVQVHFNPKRNFKAEDLLYLYLTRESTGTCESKQGESMSPKSWTLSSSNWWCTMQTNSNSNSKGFYLSV